MEKKTRSELLAKPIILALLLYLVWIGITTLTSQTPLLSVKYLLAKTWFVIPAILGCLLYVRHGKTLSAYYGHFTACCRSPFCGP